MKTDRELALVHIALGYGLLSGYRSAFTEGAAALRETIHRKPPGATPDRPPKGGLR